MLRDGWEIDAHTLTHPDLTTVDAARLRREVAGSRRWLRHAFGVPGGLLRLPVGPLQPGRRGGGPRRGLHGRDHHPARPGHAARRIPTRCRGSASRREMTARSWWRRARPRARVSRRQRTRCVAPARRRSCCTARARRASRRSSGGCWPCRPRTCARRAWRCAPARPASPPPTSTRRSPTSARWSSPGWGAARCTSSGREDYPWLLGLTAPTRLATSRRRLGQEGVAPDDAERAVKIVERALADAGPLTRPELAERIAAEGIRTEGQATPHLLMLAALRGIAVLGPLRDDGGHAFALTRDWLGAAPPRPLDGRRARRRAGRARPPLPRRPRPGRARRPRHLERPAAARRARRAGGDRPRAGPARRRPRRPRRARPRARRDPRAPAARLRPLPAGLEGPRVRRPRARTPSASIPAAGCCARRRPSTGSPSAPGARRAARSSSSSSGAWPPGAKAALQADADDVAPLRSSALTPRPIPWRCRQGEGSIACCGAIRGAARADRARAARAGRPPRGEHTTRTPTGSSSTAGNGRTAQGAAIGMRFDRPGHPVAFDTRMSAHRCAGGASWTAAAGRPSTAAPVPSAAIGRGLRVVKISDTHLRRRHLRAGRVLHARDARPRTPSRRAAGCG